MTTRRERMERRLERREEWAESRQAKANAGFRVGDEHRDEHGRMDWALVTQPGHIPERARINRAHDRAVADYQMARHHESKAAGIQHQLESSIFSDDPDALEALDARIQELTAKRDAMKAENKAFKKGNEAWVRFRFPDVDPLTLQRRMTDWAEPGRARIMEGYSWCRQPFPSYQLTNLGANIRRLEKRKKEVRIRQERQARADAAPAGIVLETSPDGVYSQVTFAEKPARQILDDLKAAGYHWSGGSWFGRHDKMPASVIEEAERGKEL